MATGIFDRETYDNKIKRLTEGRGVDVAHNSAGKDTLRENFNSLARRGACINFGASSGLPDPVAPLELAEPMTTLPTDVNVIDCSIEETGPQEGSPGSLRWLAKDLRQDDWYFELQDSVLDELRQLANFIEANPVQNLQRSVVDLALPRSRETMAKLKRAADRGPGFGVLHRLPVDEFPIDTMVEIYWLLGQLMGRPVAQKWNGQMIYSVKDTGQEYSYGVRGSHTAVELVFHTDNAFARAVPDYVGLFCVNPARSGGVSRFCSLYTVHDRLREKHPRALQRLYRSMLFDRQMEHAEGAPPVCLAPFFSWREGKLTARANTSLVRKGYNVAGVTPDAELSDALDAVDEVCTSRDIWFEAPLQRGQIQYLNNHEIGHYRSAFEDYDEPERKRHLFRLWHRESGSVTYDGLYC